VRVRSGRSQHPRRTRRRHPRVPARNRLRLRRLPALRRRQGRRHHRSQETGATLSGVEFQSSRYAAGLPAALPAWRRPLPFLYESTGIETHFTNGLDPEPRARPVFAFHTPEMLGEWLRYIHESPTGPNIAASPAPTFLARMRQMPVLIEDGLWPAQVKAVKNLEASLATNKPRALIQMATGSGKTFTSISFIYRLIKFAGARRVLFLVDRGNLGRQTKKEFDQYLSPYNNFKFGEEYIVQHLSSNNLDKSARVVICTIQRMYSMLKGRELPEEETSIPPRASNRCSPTRRR
jgi:type I restriction enzyme R subunit